MDDNQIVMWVLFTTLMLLLLVAGIFISIYMAGKRRLQQEVAITQLELTYEKELRKVETEVSEQMMEQFAQELHDNVGHILTCMRITIENKKLDEPEIEQAFLPIEGYLDEAATQLRLLSRSLNTEYIANIGLIAAIQLEVDRINQLRRQKVHWTNNANNLILDHNRELMTFRIFQEMMHNSIKHSQARNISIAIANHNGFELVVTDDGKGFDVQQTVLSPKASGLKNIQKRAQMAGFTCHIDSAPGSGCRYALTENGIATPQNN
jgi:signal transduction histidine kinase